MNSENNYARRGWLAVTALIVVLAGLSFIPPQSVSGIALRRTNIFSDLYRFEEDTATPSQVVLDEEEFSVDMAQVAEQVVAADTLPPLAPVTYEWPIAPPAEQPAQLPDSIRFAGEPQPGLIPVEDFDTTGHSSLKALYDKLIEGEPVRIAFMGDSFVEGDILTADLRERLQELYGGSGTGFAPMASPLTGFRRTVKTQSKGWTAFNIMQYRTTPGALRDSYFISGWVCQPAAGAHTRWECTDVRKYLDPADGARILFISRDNSTVEATVNDTLRRTFSIEGSPSLREIGITGGPIHSLAFRVTEGAAGFTGYGALLGSNGVGVDNYSVRSNNGQAMFRTSPTVNVQANALLDYDLIILQYGLNIMQQGIHNYSNYGEQVRKMIAYARECFPTAAILVMGVSDRSARTDSGFSPMDAIPYMIRCQRKAARDGGAAFWDTAAAMRAMGGMERFVANGWAGKDYTHINYAGGKRVAHALAAALHEGVRQTAQSRENRKTQKVVQRVISDSLQYALGRELVSPIIIN